jgi:hypothetical protein
MIKKGLVKHEFIEKEFFKELEWNSIPPDRTVWTQRDWDRTLITKITTISNTIQNNTYQGGADTIRLGSEAWVMGLDAYAMLLNRDDTRKVGSLCGRWIVYLDENVPYNEIWVSREQTTYGTFNYADMFDKKKLRGRIRINE